MDRKATQKNFYREIRKSPGRFLSIFFIVAMGVAFFSGIRASEPSMRITGDAYFDGADLMDLEVISTLGITEDDIEAFEEIEGVELAGEDAPFCGERELTIELLRNLVVNALRAGGDAPVRVTLHADGFAVSDAGCGMTKEQIARAFEPFYKADKSRARAQGGAGLGLTLCRKIARLHGGDLSIVSEPGRGTTVVYHFDTTR